MSVYTELTRHELEVFSKQFDLGALISFAGVDAGVENTTYFVSFEGHETVLQIFEEQGFSEVPFFIELNRRLGEDGVPVAIPIANRDGERLFELKDKPAVLFPRLKGGTVAERSTEACAQIGAALGQMHRATAGYQDLKRDNHRWAHWWESNVDRVLDLVPTAHQATLTDQVARSKAFVQAAETLPSGLIHGDLFVDNALFDGNTLSGIIDFYNACHGAFVFDLAVTVNDWCSGPGGQLLAEPTRALLSAYQSARPLSDSERAQWASALETAALRFWMLRLVALARKREGGPQAPPHVKDPNDFLQILLARRNDPQCHLLTD